MLGGNGWDANELNSIEEDNEELIITGSSSSTDIPGVKNNGDYDIFLFKLDIDGKPIIVE